MSEAKKCIIFSQGPVPTPEHTKVEGGGLRCWGLAQGLYENNQNLEITVAYHENYAKEKFTHEYKGIKLATWNPDSVQDLIADADTVIVSYCMGDLSTRIADNIRPDQQLVLDCYVPIYVEVSARNSAELDREYHAFTVDVPRWAHVLKRGDLFLCASEEQQKYYRGVLSGVGRINPATYGQNLILVVPYGIYRDKPTIQEKPISKLIGAGSKEKKILWFGGIYPWFDLRNLVDAVKLLNEDVPAKLVIVGAKNPFNDHPDFLKPYNDLVEHINKDANSKHVVLQDWIDFESRADWYLDSDIVTVINKEGEENSLAWRTRLVDFMWGSLPILTNGGDPLGEKLIAGGAAQRLSDTSSSGIAKSLLQIFDNPAKLSDMRKELSEIKKNYYWDVATRELCSAVENNIRAKDLQKYGDQKLVEAGPASTRSRIKRAARKGRMMPGYARKHGLRTTYYFARTVAGNQFKKVGVGHRKKPAVVMISHQLDLSGAPYVFMDLAQAIKQKTKRPIEFHAFNPVHKDNIVRLNKIKIKPKIHSSKDIGLQFCQGDTVILNTVAHSEVMKESVYSGLESGTINHLLWFIHEDDPAELFNSRETKRLKKLLGDKKITMYIAAEKALHNYQDFFDNTAQIRKQQYKYVIPEKFHKTRSANEFDKLQFLLVGSVADGRKGQLPILYAFKSFIDQHYSKNPNQYRDFDLTYVGLTNHDFISKQIMLHAPKLLGKRFKHFSHVPHEKSFELMQEANVTICYSLRECLPLFVFEGMAAGHPILRNDSSGMKEQLVDGENGLFIDTSDYSQVVSQIEKISNKKSTTNATLLAMSKLSNKIARDQAHNSYDPMVEEIIKYEQGEGAQ